MPVRKPISVPMRVLAVLKALLLLIKETRNSTSEVLDSEVMMISSMVFPSTGRPGKAPPLATM